VLAAYQILVLAGVPCTFTTSFFLTTTSQAVAASRPTRSRAGSAALGRLHGLLRWTPSAGPTDLRLAEPRQRLLERGEQNETSIVLDNRQLSTARLVQSMIATK
jgi:hypothetical protein